jgi:two-component system sensor histidine kinase CreC
MKIRTRLFVMLLLVTGLGFYKLVDWMIEDLRPRYLETMEESMNDTALLLASFLEAEASAESIRIDGLREAFDRALRRSFTARIYQGVKTRLDLMVYVTDREGIVIFDADGGKAEGQDYSRWNDVHKTLRGEYGARSSRRDPDDAASSVLYVAAPVRINGEIAGVLTVSKPADSITQFWLSARRKLVLAGMLAAAAVAGLGMLFSSWITWPIRRLTDYAHAVRDGRRVALPALGHSEIGALGRAFEQMRDALEGRDYAEHYVQTLTHEMKSPLSAIKGAVELLQEPEMPAERRQHFLDNIGRESARLQDLVERLLQLAALEKRKSLSDIEPVDLPVLVGEVIASLQPALSAKGLAVRCSGTQAVTVHGERFLLRQALANILQNALEFSPPGGTIDLDVRLDGEGAGRTVEIVVQDEGPGIPDYALDKVFERFYSLMRPDTGRKSSGIGLTFVHEVAVLHGGRVSAANRPQGGACIVLVLPLG